MKPRKKEVGQGNPLLTAEVAEAESHGGDLAGGVNPADVSMQPETVWMTWKGHGHLTHRSLPVEVGSCEGQAALAEVGYVHIYRFVRRSIDHRKMKADPWKTSPFHVVQIR